MNLPDFLYAGLAQLSAMSPWALLLSKATLLLVVAWLLHFVLARSNPRWRVFLWRGVVAGLGLLVVGPLALPGLNIRIEAPEPIPPVAPQSLPAAAASDALASPLATLGADIPARRLTK